MPCNLCGKWNCVCQYLQSKQEQEFTSCFFSREAMKEHSDFHPQPKAEKQEQGEPATLEEIRKAMIFGIPLYTTPQHREWVDLTGEELETLLRENRSLTLGAIWAVADKLKDKNNG